MATLHVCYQTVPRLKLQVWQQLAGDCAQHRQSHCRCVAVLALQPYLSQPRLQQSVMDQQHKQCPKVEVV